VRIAGSRPRICKGDGRMVRFRRRPSALAAPVPQNGTNLLRCTPPRAGARDRSGYGGQARICKRWSRRPASDLQVLWKKDESGQGLKEPGINSGGEGRVTRLELAGFRIATNFPAGCWALLKTGKTQARYHQELIWLIERAQRRIARRQESHERPRRL
jgi:hypothetical protein